MVIRKDDRVSTVLRHDPSLVEVFAAISPAFERLRNPAMRKVMSRLVTVEQAARLAGVDADALLERLNAGAAPMPPGPATPKAVPTEAARPADLSAIPAGSVIELDVREDLRSGKEPFSRIMAARRQVPEGGALAVRAIFEPVPLYAVMEKQGLEHHTEQLGPEDWRVWFYAPDRPDEAGERRDRAGGDAARHRDDGSPDPLGPVSAADEAGAGAARAGSRAAPADAVADADADTVADADVVLLDVRGLEPPEPMVRTLAALESLPPDATLVQINVRVPRFLLPTLEERGFTYEIREQASDLVRVFIRRSGASGPRPD